MFQEEVSPKVDLAKIGRSMPRERRQNGWVKKTGKKPKTWTGYWYVYIRDENGVEQYRRRKKVLGECSKMTQGAAEDRLHDLIRSKEKPTSTSTFAELTAWYLRLKEPRWSEKWNDTVNGLFNCHILPELGHRRAADIKRSEIQEAINNIGAKPSCQSESMLDKIRTQIGAVFANAIDDDQQILTRNPATKISLPVTRPPSERFLTLESAGDYWRLRQRATESF